jgi:hypothetical protein
MEIWEEAIRTTSATSSLVNVAQVAFEISKDFKSLVLVLMYNITDDKKYFEISEKIEEITIID